MNKGFSLVELIIVIAIMGILLGIIGLAVVPYVEKSGKSVCISERDTLVRDFYDELCTTISSRYGTR